LASSPNIPENPRGRKTPKRGRRQHFDSAIFEERVRTIERVFAWEDKFRRLLLRFERISDVHYALKTLAYTMINLRVRHVSPSAGRKSAWWWMAKLFPALSHSIARKSEVDAVTCCTTSSCLPGRARLVTVGCEAPGTMNPSVDGLPGDRQEPTLPAAVRCRG